MSMAIPALMRVAEMRELCRALLAYELLAGITAVRLRDAAPGDGVQALLAHVAPLIAPLDKDRSPAPDVETRLAEFDQPGFQKLYAS